MRRERSASHAGEEGAYGCADLRLGAYSTVPSRLLCPPATTPRRAGTSGAHSTYYFLGSLAARHQELELAVLQFRQAVAGAPRGTRMEAYSALIGVLWRAKKPKEIEEVCRDAIATDDMFQIDVIFNFHLALALAEQGKDATTPLPRTGPSDRLLGDIDQLQFGLRPAPGFVRAEQVERRHRVRQEAVRRVRRAGRPRADPPRPGRSALGREEARRSYEAGIGCTILDDDPDDTTACNDLGYNLAEQGRNLDEAERLIRHALEVDRLDRHRAGRGRTRAAAMYRDGLGVGAVPAGQTR